MKISKQEEYGLRILLRIARADREVGLSIPQLSELEGLSVPYTGKLTRVMRLVGLIESTRGQKGGYILAKPAETIKMSEVLDALGGQIFDPSFCESHAGAVKLCTNSVDCAVRSLWKMVHITLNHLLEKVTLADLLGSEENANNRLIEILNTQPNVLEQFSVS